MSRNKTKDEYIKEAHKLHKDKYDYSQIINLPRRDTKVNIICPIHGIFEQSFHKHLSGDGCKKCGHENIGKKHIEKSKKIFINKANSIHNNKFDYSKSIYISAIDNIIIICPIHGNFEQTPNVHLNGHGCKKCANDKTRERMSMPWEIYKEQLEKIHNNIYDYSKVVWSGVDNNIIVICSIHGEFNIRPADHKSGRGCAKCSKNKNKCGDDNIEIILQRFCKKWGDLYDYSKVEYKDSLHKVRIICKIHGTFCQTPDNHLNGIGCKKCVSWDIYKDKLKIIHNNIYDYSKVIWRGVDYKIIVICPNHGEFNITPFNHKNGKGCGLCFKKITEFNNKRNNKELFITNSTKKWGGLYDYSKVNYITTQHKVTIICKKHGEFEQLPLNHIKHGCGACGKLSNKRNIYINETCKKEFEEKANNIHCYRYDYSKVNYEYATKKVIIICKMHGDFDVSPNNHLNGKGCPTCGKEISKVSRLKTFDEYYNEFISLYGEKYDYSYVEWKGGSKTISIICKKHGAFDILPYLHRDGKECQKCSNRYSNVSVDWLEYMKVKYSIDIQHAKNTGEYVIPGSRYKADGYGESVNTIFEFNGDFWHGNPYLYDKTDINPRTGTTYGYLYEQTLIKSNFIKNNGYKLIEIWENDWNKFIKIVKKIQIKWRLKLSVKKINNE